MGLILFQKFTFQDKENCYEVSQELVSLWLDPGDQMSIVFKGELPIG